MRLPRARCSSLWATCFRRRTKRATMSWPPWSDSRQPPSDEAGTVPRSLAGGTPARTADRTRQTELTEARPPARRWCPTADRPDAGLAGHRASRYNVRTCSRRPAMACSALSSRRAARAGAWIRVAASAPARASGPARVIEGLDRRPLTGRVAEGRASSRQGPSFLRSVRRGTATCRKGERCGRRSLRSVV